MEGVPSVPKWSTVRTEWSTVRTHVVGRPYRNGLPSVPKWSAVRTELVFRPDRTRLPPGEYAAALRSHPPLRRASKRIRSRVS